jgi:hypothetical protein
VWDPSGAAVPNAKVAVTNEGTSLERRVTTNVSGYYVASSLPSGYYTVSIEIVGFKRFVTTRNKLDPNIPKEVSATLEVGAATDSVEVVAAATSVQTETATVGRLVEQSQVENLMLNGRDPMRLALLKAGVQGGDINTFTFSLTSGPSINGARSGDTSISYDGAVALRTRGNGNSVGTADLDSVEEMQILTATYAAEYGRSAGGQIRIVTKSGSREFHGRLYEYVRNYALDGNDWSNNRAGQNRPTNKFNQFGYNFSGPVYIPGKWNTNRSKLFALWSQEWVRYRENPTSIITVPSLAMKRGDFSELLNPANPFFGKAQVLKDPNTGQPLPGNVIPAAQLSHNGLALLSTYPDPTPGFLQGTNNFIQTRPQPTNQRKDVISVDFIPTEMHTFRFRYQNYEFLQATGFESGTDRCVRDSRHRPAKTASVNYIWTISPTTINEFVATASVDRNKSHVDQTTGRCSRETYGINYPLLFPVDLKVMPDKIPTTAISNFATVDGTAYPSSSAGPIYVVADSITKVVQNHTFKWGFSYEHSGENDFDQINVTGVPGGSNNQNGRFVFDNTRTGAGTTGLAVANAAMGLFTTYAEIGQKAYTPYRSDSLDAFVQDAWKVRPKLSVEVGVRYTIMTPYFYSLWGNMAEFDPTRYNPAKAVVQDPKTGYIISGSLYNGVVFPGTSWPAAVKGRVLIAQSGQYNSLFSGGNSYWGQLQKLNFQPRLGIAYSLNTKTVLRAGFGQFLSKPGISDNVFLGGNPPFQPMVSIANGGADNPASGQPSNFPLFFMTTDPVFKIPESYNWSLTVERQVGFNTIVQVGYVGRASLHLERTRDINQLQAGTLQNPANAGINANVLRPYKGFSNIYLEETAARAEYNALQLEVNRRFLKGLRDNSKLTSQIRCNGVVPFR